MRTSLVLLVLVIYFWILRYLYINGVVNFVLFIVFSLFLFRVNVLKSCHDSHYHNVRVFCVCLIGCGRDKSDIRSFQEVKKCDTAIRGAKRAILSIGVV